MYILIRIYGLLSLSRPNSLYHIIRIYMLSRKEEMNGLDGIEGMYILYYIIRMYIPFFPSSPYILII